MHVRNSDKLCFFLCCDPILVYQPSMVKVGNIRIALLTWYSIDDLA